MTKNQNNHFLNNKDDIQAWLQKHRVNHYFLNKFNGQYIVDVEDTVSLSNMHLKEIPVQFGQVVGAFYCSHNQLTSLLGTPKDVLGNFDCSYNNLSTLTHSPLLVGGDFNCEHNQIKSLIGLPEILNGSVNCIENMITNLEGLPSSIGLNLKISKNPINSLKHLPKKIGGSLVIINTSLNQTKLDELIDIEVGNDFQHIVRNEWEMIPCLKNYYIPYLTPEKYITITQELLEKVLLENQLNQQSTLTPTKIKL